MGQYTIFYTLNSDGSPSKNLDDNYLKSKTNQIYRYSDTTLAILLTSGSASVKSLLPKFEEQDIKVWNIISGEVCMEAVLGINECDIHKVHKIMKFMIKGKNEQLKVEKLRVKAEELKFKLKEEKFNTTDK